jgi:hypothetical protein
MIAARSEEIQAGSSFFGSGTPCHFELSGRGWRGAGYSGRRAPVEGSHALRRAIRLREAAGRVALVAPDRTCYLSNLGHKRLHGVMPAVHDAVALVAYGSGTDDRIIEPLAGPPLT